ncbi:MAG: hypothetical protein ABIS21_06475 [Acidimicrobiales bacterium]
MGARGDGFSRRQFLIGGAGGAAALWAGGVTLRRRSGGGVGADGAGDGPAAATIRSLPFISLPFIDTFADTALPAWNVRRPVTVLGTTPFGRAFPSNQTLDRPAVLAGRGTVLGLDGRLAGTTGPGLLETIDPFAFEAGSTYELTLGVAGSQQRADRMPPSTVVASLPGLGISTHVVRRPMDGFRPFTLQVPVTRSAASTIVVASGNAPGQAGVLLQFVSLARTA